MDTNNQQDSLDRPFLAYEGDERYIFISYAHKDAERVFSEIEKFHDEGYPVWYDQGLTPGQEWDEEIEEALLDASLMIVFISKNSMASINVVDEIKLALEERIDIVPIYLEDAKLARGLRLRLSQKHAIFKYQMSEKDYLFDCFRAFKKAKIPQIEFDGDLHSKDDETPKQVIVESENVTNDNVSWKRASIFIDGTFSDMHAERNFLIKEVFPEFSQWCQVRKIDVVPVDLRWGITEEESKNRSTIKACLDVIDGCRPFYMCFLGQRRGWVPNMETDVSQSTLDFFPDLVEAEGLSVTELGIRHALRPFKSFKGDLAPAKYSMFFFRNPNYLSNLTPAQELIYTNKSDENPDYSDERLYECKQRIYDLANHKEELMGGDIFIDVVEYEGHWNSALKVPELSAFCNNDEDLGRLTDFECGDKPLKDVIIETLKQHFEDAFPENMNLTSRYHDKGLEEELKVQDDFCYRHSNALISHPRYVSCLDDYLWDADENGICLVSAEPGFGKTPLMADYSSRVQYGGDIKVYTRFGGISDISSDIYTLWKSIIDEAGIGVDEMFYPENTKSLIKDLPDILSEIAKRGKTLIIIDSINKVANGLDFMNVACSLPDNLKMIVSVKEDDGDFDYMKRLETIRVRDYMSDYSFHMEGILSDEDKKFMIKEYLRNHLKELDDYQIQKICDLPASDNPLFIKILLDELIVFGSFDKLNEKILSFGDTPVTAFKSVLDRLEEDERYSGMSIVPLMFSLLANSKEGLSEDDLVSILVSDTGYSYEEVESNVRLNLRQLRSYMIVENYYDFFYASFKQAAQEKYIELNSHAQELLVKFRIFTV